MTLTYWLIAAPLALVVGVLLISGGRWFAGAVLGLASLLRDDTPGRHRPDTRLPVGDLYAIRYPHLYRRYEDYVGRYGYGADQAAHWAWRKARLAELRANAARRRALREAEADYRWLSAYEQTSEIPAVRP